MDKKTGWAVALIVLGMLGVVAYTVVSQFQKTITLRLHNTVLSATVADTEALREKGLAGREKLGRNEAMLFVFDRDDEWEIWMQGMKFPIDVLWLNKDKEIVHITKNISPDTYPKHFKPVKPARYVLEVEAGRVDVEKIRVGQQANFDLPAR